MLILPTTEPKPEEYIQNQPDNFIVQVEKIEFQIFEGYCENTR